MDIQKIRNPKHYHLTPACFRSRQSVSKPGSGFIPVQLTDPKTPSGEGRIEIRFPSGIEVVLTGPQATTMADSLLSAR